jgi:hypothetical protein
VERPVTLYECKEAIHRLGLAKAAGPDKLPAEFYKSFEELIVHDLYNTLIEAHGLGFLPLTMREGDMVLLYKKGDLRDRLITGRSHFCRSTTKYWQKC